MQYNDPITHIGRTTARNAHTPFGIRQADRLQHMFILGQTGTGKSTLLRNLILQDIVAGRGCALIDPHGDLVESVVDVVPHEQQHRVIDFDVTNPNLSYGYNPFAYIHADRRPLLASGILEIFQKLWPKEWGVRMEHLFRNAILTLLEQPHATLKDVTRLFQDKQYRQSCLRNVENQTVLDFWKFEFEKYHPRLKAEATIPINNKLGGFLANPTLKRILCESEEPIRLRSIMDDERILLVNLAKGQIGQDATNLLGSMLMTSIGLAAYSRSDMDGYDRRPIYVHIDEAHNFVTLSTAAMMAELRKYGVALTLVNQYSHQMTIDVREAIFGNAGSLLAFRTGSDDARILEREFRGSIKARDVMSLPNYEMYVRLMIDGAPSNAFSARTTI
ncbi:MAG: DUF87 domain-containing protein [Pseudomonadota bacterium]